MTWTPWAPAEDAELRHCATPQAAVAAFAGRRTRAAVRARWERLGCASITSGRPPQTADERAVARLLVQLRRMRTAYPDTAMNVNRLLPALREAWAHREA